MTHKAHDRIWLQVDPDGESCDPEQWDLAEDATWCREKINDSDVEYIRADLVKAQVAVARENVAKAIYMQWRDVGGYVPWVEGGNSLMQDSARRIAGAALEQFAAKVREQCEKACESEYVTEVDADDAVYNSAITYALRAIRNIRELP